MWKKNGDPLPTPLLRSPHLIKIWKKTGRKLNEINVANQAISTDQNGEECVRIRSVWETRGHSESQGYIG